ncbi:MAG: sulfatase-like hydrolase/transferase [Terriglobales bacterium]|jgi:arylsulfatase A-like enzyme/Flp pilus assembly protein TadD
MVKRRSILILMAMAGMAAGVPAFGQGAAGARKDTVVPRSPKPSVILITIDTVRADHVGCYGAANVKTPTLDGLAHDGVVFERAISQVPLTWPSHAVILTGTYPFQNGVQDFTGQPLGPQFRSVAQAFHQAGYATGAVVSAFVLDRSWGLGRGFDYYDDAFAASEFATKDIGLVERRADESVQHAIAWLKKTPKRPFFLWLHLYDPHSPYDPPEPFGSEYSGHLYDGEIAYADHELGGLIAWLKQNQLYDSSLIVMLSDHGESLGEHGEDEHGFFVYNSTVRVPLIVKPPAGSGVAAGRKSEPVETAAVAPTLLQLAGVKDSIQAQFQAPSLMSAKSGKDPAYSETFYPLNSFGWSPLRALESEKFHLIDAPKPELYDLASDPNEMRNIADEQPATVAVMREKLRALAAHNPFQEQAGKANQGAGNLTPEAQEKLRSLGYFGFRASISPEVLKNGLPDPKDKIGEFNTILKAGDLFQQNRDEDAIALLHHIQERDPRMYVIPFMLGESELRGQRWNEATEELSHCLELNPNFDNAMTGLALALSKLGRGEEARQWLDKAAQINPGNYRAWYQKGLLDQAGNPTAAQADFEKAIAIQPNFAPGQREEGMLLFEHKDYTAAAIHLEKAIGLGLDSARTHNYLGICYAQTKRIANAIREHQRAIELDPKLAEAHLNLGFDYEKLGNTKAAETEYARACQLSASMCQLVKSRPRQPN